MQIMSLIFKLYARTEPIFEWSSGLLIYINPLLWPKYSPSIDKEDTLKSSHVETCDSLVTTMEVIHKVTKKLIALRELKMIMRKYF